MNANLFAAHEAQHKASVMYDTWGHLDPKPNVIYKVTFFVAHDGREALHFKVNMPDLDGGPGFYSDICTYAFNRFVRSDLPEGVYKFEGRYQLYKRPKPNCEMYGFFKGKVTKVKLP
ncbi:MAG TPA: hypothetical protein EYH52_11020 [Acinetobacter venetianus]|uniref:hypothetical protein n=1 Tax=Acinetobacter venetianus TaxID=52133 RepID=UPI001A152831|nr:hypothetical protein [Acinetobacter venetianus]HIQ35151.1 hypothetical protein [Acinetobacter venetianus]